MFRFTFHRFFFSYLRRLRRLRIYVPLPWFLQKILKSWSHEVLKYKDLTYPLVPLKIPKRCGMIKRFRINSTRVFIDSMALAIKFLELTHSSSQHRAHKYSFYWAFFVGLTSSQLVRSSEKIMNEIKSTTKKRFSKYWPLRYLIIKLENAIGTNNIIGMR